MKYSDYKPEESCQIAGLQGILAGTFGLKDNGIFVEIGAYNGRDWSNTYQLAVLGWKGVYVEPVPEIYQALLGNHKDRPNITCINAFVSSEDGEEIDMFMFENMYTGNDDFKKFGGKFVTKAKTLTLDKVLEITHIPSDFDLLVIDVEGHELEVLKGFTYLMSGTERYYMPRMVIIETHAFHTDERFSVHAAQINAYMLDNDYIRIYADDINSIYILP